MSELLIGSVPYLQRVEGWRDGAGAHTRNLERTDSPDYEAGYLYGCKAREEYIKWLNEHCSFVLSKP